MSRVVQGRVQNRRVGGKKKRPRTKLLDRKKKAAPHIEEEDQRGTREEKGIEDQGAQPGSL